jgi:hypothetical protein
MTVYKAFRSLSIAASLLAAGACYNEVPLGMAVPAPESRVIAKVTDVGAQRLEGSIGPGATEIEGIVESATDSAWRIRLLRVDQVGGMSTAWNRELVTFPRFALTSPSTKQVSKTKSWVFAGAVTVGAVLAATAFSGWAEADPRGGDGEPALRPGRFP